MSVHLFTLSDMRLANGAKVPFGCDLDRQYAQPPSYAGIEVEAAAKIRGGIIGISAEVADTTALVHVEGADPDNPWPTVQTDFMDDARAVATRVAYYEPDR